MYRKAAPGFEPGMEVLQTSALPLGYAARHLITYYIKILSKFALSILVNPPVYNKIQNSIASLHPMRWQY